MKKLMVGLLGLCAGPFAGLSIAWASDAALKPAPPGDYLKICSAAGEGFFTIPGTDTCLKIGGYIASVATVFVDSTVPDATTSLRTRARLEFSTWQDTTFGPLESFVRLQPTSEAGGAVPIDGIIDQAYVRLGGFTFGRATSIFDFYNDQAYNVFGFDPYVRSAQTTTDQITYLATIGAFDFGLSLEDQFFRDQGAADGILDTDTDGDGLADADVLDGEKTFPDIVARARYSGESFSAQVMAALHDKRAPLAGVPSRVGFAVGAGLSVNLPVLEGGTLVMEGAYSEGAISYNGGFIDIPEAYLDGAGKLQLAKGYNIAGEYLQTVTENFKITLFGSYFHVDTPAFAASDLTEHVAGANLIWSIIPDKFDIIPQYQYTRTQFEGAEATHAHEATLAFYRYF